MSAQFPEVLGGGGEENFVFGAGETAQPETVELEDSFHVGEGNLDQFAFMAGAMEGRALRQGASIAGDRFVDAAGAAAYGVDNDAYRVIDHVAGIIGKGRPFLLLRYPTRQWIGERDRLGRFGSLLGPIGILSIENLKLLVHRP